jgi:hypothetical protein
MSSLITNLSSPVNDQIMRASITCILVIALSEFSGLHGQSLTEPEPQISFVKEDKPHEYYVAQAELWWQKVEEDKSDDLAWYYYYRACRSAQGTANWSTDFVNEAPNLRLGKDIVKMMEEEIPNSFTYHYVKGSTGGADPRAGEHLMKAYAMNPDFPGLLADVVTFATASLNPALRKEANQRWYQNRELSASLMDFGYNLLQSVDTNAILLTTGDNDTYPLWMLQDALGIREDVLVLNIDFFLFGGYREPVFESLGLAPFQLEHVDINEYEKNWSDVVKHFIVYYSGDRPLYIAQTIDPVRYEGFDERLHVSGLALRFGDEKLNLMDWNTRLNQEVFRWDNVDEPIMHNTMQSRVDQMNLNYLPMLEMLYRDKKSSEAKHHALRLMARKPNDEYVKKMQPFFE